ncbi:MAG: flagellar basal body protein FliL [Gammaproteobacteria bacterium]|nr:MAG: flagellar basal body protein FliL [Gammaproteobacteria bacterium]
MAAGKKDDKADKDKEQAPADDAAVTEAKKKKKKLFMFIGLAILLVLISVGATFFIVSKMMGSKHADEDSASEASEAEEVVAAPAIYYPLKPNFTVNYDVNGRQRFLQAELTLMYRDPEVLKTLELHMPAVRNGLVMLLSSQVFEELQTLEGKEKLRAAALATVQEIINKETAALAEKSKSKDDEDSEDEESDTKKGKGKNKEKKTKPPEPNIEQVLFTQFVMQ